MAKNQLKEAKRLEKAAAKNAKTAERTAAWTKNI
jgi:hypothetical protein